MRLLHRKWRHHGLGMLQSEVTPTLRIHVWHPSLFAMWYFKDPFRRVHDHRFDLHSTVLLGTIQDQPYNVLDEVSHVVTPNTKCWTVVHAKEQHRNPKTRGTEFLYDVDARPLPIRTYEAGSSYTIARGAFHTTLVDSLSITLVHRQNFSTQSARVLGMEAEPGIVAFDSHGGHGHAPNWDLWNEILGKAEEASSGIDL